MNMRITMMMLLRHSGHVSITVTRFAARAALAKARMSAGYQREPLAWCQETHFTSAAVCGAVDVVVGVASVTSVVIVVVVAVSRLQHRRVSVYGMTNGTQELESRIRPVVELGQTGLNS